MTANDAAPITNRPNFSKQKIKNNTHREHIPVINSLVSHSKLSNIVSFALRVHLLNVYCSETTIQSFPPLTADILRFVFSKVNATSTSTMTEPCFTVGVTSG